MIETILGHDNIHLFSFNDCPELTADLNNYKDTVHYGTWINSLILRWMHDGKHQITEDNYLDYIQRVKDFYTTFDYSTMNTQEDYEYSFYAAALVNEEVTGAKPVDLLTAGAEIRGAGQTEDSSGGQNGILCAGTLQRGPDEGDLAEYLLNSEFIGVKADMDLSNGHCYLTFCGKRLAGAGQPSVFVYDSGGNVIRSFTLQSSGLDYEWHRYVVNLYGLDGKYTVILNGGAVDSSQKADSSYAFSDIILY